MEWFFHGNKRIFRRLQQIALSLTHTRGGRGETKPPRPAAKVFQKWRKLSWKVSSILLRGFLHLTTHRLWDFLFNPCFMNQMQFKLEVSYDFINFKWQRLAKRKGGGGRDHSTVTEVYFHTSTHWPISKEFIQNCAGCSEEEMKAQATCYEFLTIIFIFFENSFSPKAALKSCTSRLGSSRLWERWFIL